NEPNHRDVLTTTISSQKRSSGFPLFNVAGISLEGMGAAGLVAGPETETVLVISLLDTGRPGRDFLRAICELKSGVGLGGRVVMWGPENHHLSNVSYPIIAIPDHGR